MNGQWYIQICGDIGSSFDEGCEIGVAIGVAGIGMLLVGHVVTYEHADPVVDPVLENHLQLPSLLARRLLLMVYLRIGRPGLYGDTGTEMFEIHNWDAMEFIIREYVVGAETTVAVLDESLRQFLIHPCKNWRQSWKNN